MNNNQFTPTAKIQPNFSHRITENHTDMSDVAFTLLSMTDRALSILQLLSYQFDAKKSDSHIFGAIDTIIQELNDVQAYVSAFEESQTAKQ